MMLSEQDMFDYGYTWDGMIPLTMDEALRVWDFENKPVYKLYDDGTESLIEDRDEIFIHHDVYHGIFGIEKD